MKRDPRWHFVQIHHFTVEETEAQNDMRITQLGGRVNESLQTLSGVILLHIFQLRFCFLCGLKYTTEIHAHILENV